MRITPLRSRVSDNWFYLVVDGSDALLIDPVDADVAVDAVEPLGAIDLTIVATHGHHDHVAGIPAVASRFGARVFGPAISEPFGARYERGLSDGETVPLGATRFTVRHAPGHTPGHVTLHTDAHGGLLFSGDTLFVAGCGNCRFGGDVDTLAETLDRVLAPLPDSVRFFPGHDYAAKNLQFARHVDPDNPSVTLAERALQASEPPFTTTLGDERRYNPFLRTREPSVAARAAELAGDDETDRGPRATFRRLRALRDGF